MWRCGKCFLQPTQPLPPLYPQPYPPTHNWETVGKGWQRSRGRKARRTAMPPAHTLTHSHILYTLTKTHPSRASVTLSQRLLIEICCLSISMLTSVYMLQRCKGVEHLERLASGEEEKSKKTVSCFLNLQDVLLVGNLWQAVCEQTEAVWKKTYLTPLKSTIVAMRSIWSCINSESNRFGQK